MENITSLLVSSLFNKTFTSGLVESTSLPTGFPVAKNDAFYPQPDNTSDDRLLQSNATFTSESNIDKSTYLQNLSTEAANRNILVVIFLVLLMLSGTVGNLLVLYVYSCRFKRSSSSYFIISLAIFDLLACTVSIPTEIYDIQNKYTFYHQSVCILLRYSGTFVQYASAYLLVGVAIDRYIKICYPLKMIPSLKIKWMCVVATIAGFLSSIPTIILFGIKKEKTNIASIFGSNCSIAEKFINSRLRRYYFLVVSILFVLCVLVMIILYVLIWCTVKRRRGSVIGDSVKRRPSDLDNGKPMRIKKQCSTNSDDNNNSVFWEEGERASLKRGRRRRMSSVSAVLKKIKVTRTTLLLFAVTAAFVISYLPAIMAMVLKKKILRLRHGELIYTFFVKFTFINNANNPIIYSFLNVNFRNECKKVFQKVYCGKNGPPSRQTSMETEEDIK